MTELPDKLSKTYWAKKHDEELEMLSDLTGKTADEIERDLSEPDVHAQDEYERRFEAYVRGSIEYVDAVDKHDFVSVQQISDRLNEDREWLLDRMRGCDHGGDKHAVQIKALERDEQKLYVYRCECGVLLLNCDFTSKHVMSADEIEAAVQAAIEKAKREVE
jgi:hypothetical protein